jgi:hypothetical protein
MLDTRYWMLDVRIAYRVSRIAYIETLNTKSEALNKSKTQITKQDRTSRPYNV